MRLEVTLDCLDPESLASFWAAALGYRRQSEGHRYITLVPGPGESGVPLVLQRVDEPKLHKARMHLDLYVADAAVEAEVERLAELGASVLDGSVVVEDGERWIVMVDPAGNEFCVCGEPT